MLPFFPRKSIYANSKRNNIQINNNQITKIRKELNIVTFSPELLIKNIYDNFKVGDIIPLANIKSTLTDIYTSINYQKSPKATDLSTFFEVKVCFMDVIVDGKKKRARGYELTQSHESELRQKLNLI